MHDYQDYLVVDSVWDATLDSSDTPTRPNGTTVVNRAAGLLNAYEYYTTYNHSDGLATYETGYLNKEVCWWLMTPYNALRVRSIRDDGFLNYVNPVDADGIRPSVNLKSEIQISSMSEDGTISNPYRLIRDRQETVGGTTLLNTRYSGEYVRFNDELYRIVDIEDNLTKITAVDKPIKLASNQFHSVTGVTSFASASIKTDLENYYQSNINETYKIMIEPNTVWYLGTIGGGVNYKASICATVDVSISSKDCKKISHITTANIGLPRVREMFTSQITRGTKSSFWTLTPYGEAEVRCVYAHGRLVNSNKINENNLRLSIYLKSDVVISKNNTGDGTYEKPYDIELEK